MPKLEGLVALVTGATRGIGAATARKLCAEGCRTVLVDLDEPGCNATVQSLRSDGYEAIALGCDVSSSSQVQTTMAETVRHFGKLDILVNNAGLIRDDLIHKMTDDEWDIVLNVHLKGTFLCSRAAQRYMVEQRFGRIVNVSSTSALGNRGQANYSAAKAGIQGLTRTLALELGQFGITANAVAPGFIDTAMTRSTAQRLGIPEDQYQTAAAQRIALRRIGRPEEVASVVAFLASEDASYVSGQIIYVAGGPAGILM